MNRHAGTQRSCDPYVIIAYRIMQERFDEADQDRIAHPARGPYIIRALRHIKGGLRAAHHSLVAHPLWKHVAGHVG